MTTREKEKKQQETNVILTLGLNDMRNGEHFEVVINEKKNSFEVKVQQERKYFFEWEYKRENFLSFIVSALETPEYLYYKLAEKEGKHDIDILGTIKNIQRVVERAKKDGMIREENQQKIISLLKEMKARENMRYEELESFWDEKFDSLIESGYLRECAWNDENVLFFEDEECVDFCMYIAPCISNILKNKID